MISPELSIIGNLNWDMILSSVQDWPSWGTEVFVAASSRIPGGIAHSSLAARRQGMLTSAVGCVGRDQEGDQILEILHSHGVVTDASLRSDAPTGLSVGIVRSDGERTYFTVQGALAGASIADLWHASSSGLTPTQYVLFSGLPLIRPVTVARGLSVLRDIRERGLQSAIDVGWDPAGWPEARAEEVRKLYAAADFVIVNEVEAAALLHDPRHWASQYANTVIARLGARGVRIYRSQEEIVEPGFPVDAVDTGGAGDVWNGSFFRALGRGHSMAEAARWANASAALYVSRPSGPERYPTTPEVERFMEIRGNSRQG